MPTIAGWRKGPWQEDPGPQFPLTPSAQAFGHQGAFIFGHRPADLPPEMRLWVLPQRLSQNLDATASPLDFFQPHHLLDLMAGESIGARNHDTGDRGLLDTVPEPSQSWPIECGTTVAVVAKNLL